MAASITYRNYNVFIQEYEEALIEISSQLNGFVSDSRKIYAYRSNSYERFLEEFEEVIINNLEHGASIKSYMAKVYYEGVCRLLLRFQMLEARMLASLNEDWDKALKNETFIVIRTAYIDNLSFLAGHIFSLNQKHAIAPLKLFTQVELKDFNISGEYIGGNVDKVPPKAKPTVNLTLKDIWRPNSSGNKDEYDALIEYLKEENLDIEGPFITEQRGQLHWNKNPQKGWIQYIAALVHICIKKKWILDQYSAPQLASILSNTFNVRFNHKPLQQVAASPTEAKYLKPFKDLPANL
ncbi:hypothetical protein H9Q13_06175 [Pontibacter sp. JH31]|uniref:Uncharacterized protein n=1 Tax=Pontibacter aquaedesilientis TaxID=2766980 RepID=A0ABR7XEQ1_9BACT|nr:hypothetical protein [Pontibacter aquaedesilientis]MBD1396747.1 hypothetical protein [Pontibacter aquaedesilientis]